jgi:hypothetical protein
MKCNMEDVYERDIRSKHEDQTFMRPQCTAVQPRSPSNTVKVELAQNLQITVNLKKVKRYFSRPK